MYGRNTKEHDKQVLQLMKAASHKGLVFNSGKYSILQPPTESSSQHKAWVPTHAKSGLSKAIPLLITRQCFNLFRTHKLSTDLPPKPSIRNNFPVGTCSPLGLELLNRCGLSLTEIMRLAIPSQDNTSQLWLNEAHSLPDRGSWVWPWYSPANEWQTYSLHKQNLPRCKKKRYPYIERECLSICSGLENFKLMFIEPHHHTKWQQATGNDPREAHTCSTIMTTMHASEKYRNMITLSSINQEKKLFLPTT